MTESEGKNTKKFTFAVVGAGQIAQQAFIPALRQLPEAELGALVTSTPEKAEAYGVPGYSYEDYQKLLDSHDVDAIYVAVPIARHKEFTIPALEAGYPVLCEKPMAPSVEDCEAMIEASERNNSPLMLAYRMHHDPYTIDLIQRVRNNEFGELRSFTSSFGHMINPENHRAQNGFWAGPVPDIGLYPLNLVRNIYEEEPTTVFAHGVEHEDSTLQVTPTVAVTLGFDSGKTAQFTVSYATESQEGFMLSGTQGIAHSDSVYMWGDDAPLNVTLSIPGEDDGQPKTLNYSPKDQFAGEIRYFLQCVAEGKHPEADGEEGLMDIRICEAIEESLRTGQVQSLEPRERSRRISLDQGIEIPAQPKPTVQELTKIVSEEV